MFSDLLNQSVKSSFDANSYNSVYVPPLTLTHKMGGVYALNEPSRELSTIQTLAGHDFSVDMVPVHLANGTEVPDKRIAVDDNGSMLGNGIVSNNYMPCQPSELYSLAGHMLGLDDEMTITDVVTSRNKNMIGLQLNKGSWSPTGEFGDRLENNLLLLTTFDGTKPTSIRTINFRPKCSNQYAATKQLASIRHTSRSDQRIFELRRLLTVVTQQIEHTNEQIQALVYKAMSKKSASKWFSDLLLSGKDLADMEGRAKTVHDNKLSDFERILRTGAGYEAGENTAYAAFNALTNYCTHERATRSSENTDENEARWDSNLFGSAASFAQSGFDRLVKM